MVVDEHTLELLIGDVSYISIPPSPTQSIPALLTIELPSDVKRGQQFNVSIFQIDGLERQILGAFEFVIPVSAAALILPEEERTLSVFKHIAEAIPSGNLWGPIFDRQIARLSDKVRGLGGNPDFITPSPDGDGRIDQAPDGPRELTPRCLVIGLLLALLLGMGIASIQLLAWLFSGITLVALTILFYYWVKNCKVSTGLLLKFLVLSFLIGLTLLEVLR